MASKRNSADEPDHNSMQKKKKSILDFFKSTIIPQSPQPDAETESGSSAVNNSTMCVETDLMKSVTEHPPGGVSVGVKKQDASDKMKYLEIFLPERYKESVSEERKMSTLH